MDKLKDFFEKSSDISRDSYVWNMASSTLFAVQSAIALMAITRTNGLDDAGVFSIAYAVASLIYYVAEYGVRKYQVSDVQELFSFTDYHAHRITVCAIAFVATVGYVAIVLYRQGYTIQKAYVVFALCIIKIVEAYSEVYFGRYQQVGRLDVAAKTNLFRIIVALIGFIATLVMTHNIVVSVTAWLITSIVAMLMSSILVFKDFGQLKLEFDWQSITKIMIDCFPIFLGYFLLLYIGNAPKYAIDLCMSDQAQAIYNFIFMPVFAVGMFANFVFNPILVNLAQRWDERNINVFLKIVLKQIWIIAAITLMAIAVALTVGTPILGILFSANLMNYKIDLAILMIGGGMLASVNFFAVVVTVMRHQKYLTIGYILMAAIAFAMSNKVVQTNGIRGASVLYTVLMTAQMLIFAVITFRCISKESTR